MRINYGNISRRIDTTPAAIVTSYLFSYDFMANTTLPAELSLSRATVGSVFDDTGVMQTAAIDAPRFEHTYNGTSWVAAGLLVEEQRTNPIANSSYLNAWGGYGSPVTGFNDSVAPDGGSYIAKICEFTSTNTIFTFYSGITFNSPPSTFSIFAKARSTGSKRWLSMSISTNEGAVFDVVTKTVTQTTISSASIVDVGNGWCRCIVTGVGLTSSICPISLADAGTFTFESNGFHTHTGDSVSGLNTFTGQPEVGSFATSPILTNATGLTRSADLVSATGLLASQLTSGPSVWELTDQATGTISRVQYAAGTFDFPTSKLYRSFAVYPPSTDTSPYLTVGGPYT